MASELVGQGGPQLRRLVSVLKDAAHPSAGWLGLVHMAAGFPGQEQKPFPRGLNSDL